MDTSDVRLLFKAETYDFDEIGNFSAIHPEAPGIDIAENLLIVGSAGAGKSMAMRQASYRLRYSESVLPLYIHAERYIARPLSEAVTSAGRSSRVGRKSAEVCATAALAIGTLSRLLRVAGEEVAYAAAQIFPGRPRSPSSLSEWLNVTFHECDYIIRSSDALPDDLRKLPPLREVLESFGDAVGQLRGRRLLLLFDQLDRLNTLYLDLLGPALGRSTSYVLAVATRPSPCAPDPTQLPLRTGDCNRHWIGANWTSREWKSFLIEAAQAFFDENICAELEKHIDLLAPMVGPSVRSFLMTGKELSRIWRGNGARATAIHRALNWMKGSVEADLVPALVGYPDSNRFLRNLQNELSLQTKPERTLWPGRIVIRPKDRLFLGEKAVERARVAVREGLLVPADPSRYGLDEVGFDYQVVPLIGMKSLPVTPPEGLDEDTLIDEERFVQWSHAPRGGRRASGSPERAKIFYSYWMSEENAFADEFLREFRKLVHLKADVVIGESDSSEHLPDFIRGVIRDSALTVVQLYPVRPTVGLEIGWAMGSSKPILLAMQDPRELDDFPTWLRSFEIKSNGTAEEQSRLAHTALALVEAADAGDEGVQWRVDPEGHALTALRRELRQIAIVGSGEELAVARARLTERLQREGLREPLVVDTGDEARGARLFDAVRAAFPATVLLAVFSGRRSPDLLTSIALGAHTHQDTEEVYLGAPGSTRRRRTMPRAACVLATEDAIAQTMPTTMIGGLRGSLVTPDTRRALDEAWEKFRDIKERTDPH